MTEEAKAERRKVIANNKAYESALTVRTEWIAARSRVPRCSLPAR